MDDAYLNYWIECIESSFDEHEVKATPEQVKAIAADIQGAHENYGMAFYQPPPSDRLNVIEATWSSKYKALEKELDDYRNNAETAVKRALRQYPDALVSIHENGEVFLHGGRTEQIL